MGKVFLTCFPNFHLKGGNPCPPLNDDALRFCSSLSEDLTKLEQSLVESSVSLRWSTEAMNMLKKMQVQFLMLAEKSSLPLSLDDDDDWLDKYMKETVMLLDFCNLLKNAISGMERYRMVVDFTVKKLNDNSSVAANRTAIEQLEKESTKLQNVEKWGEAQIDKIISECGKWKKSTHPVMLAVESTMIIVSLILVSAVTSPVSIDTGRDVSNEFPQLGSFAASFVTLIYRFRERIRRPEASLNLGFIEKEMVEKMVTDLKKQVAEGMIEDRENLLESVDMLKKRSVDLKKGLEMFDSAVNEVFEEVIRGRKKLLEMLRSSTVT